MIRKYLNRILDQKVDLQERMFRLVATIGVMSLTLMLFCKLLIGEAIVNVAILACFIAVITAIGIICVKKGQVNTGAVIAAVLLLIFLPVNFSSLAACTAGHPFGLFLLFCISA